MLAKNILMKHWDGTQYSELHPITSSENVITKDNTTVQQELDDNENAIKSHIADYVRQPGYASATGSANTYAVALSPIPATYAEGMALAVKINVSNTGAATINVNGLGAKAIKKANGNDVSTGNLRAGSIYTLRYSGLVFILQGEGGEYGSAGPAQVLTGYNIGTESGLIAGTMPNNSALNYTPGQTVQSIPAGYTSGGSVAAVSFDAAKVLNDTTIAGKQGTMPSNGALNYTPGQASQSIPAGYTSGGSVAPVVFDATKVLAGTTIASKAGTMPNRVGDTAALASSVSGTTLKLRASTGYRDGVDDNVTITDPDFIASNIRKDVNLFGLVGTLVEGMKYATGTFTRVSNQSVTVSGLAFTPQLIILKWLGQESIYGVAAYISPTLTVPLDPDTTNGGNAYVNASGSTIPSPFTINADGFTMSNTIGPPTGTSVYWAFTTL